MRRRHLLLFTLAASLASASPGAALEKRAVRVPEGGTADEWNAGATEQIWYYNLCTGWAWTWSGWDAFDTVGMCFETDFYTVLHATTHFTWSGAPSGYGFTGVAILSEDQDGDGCPGAVLVQQPWLADQSGFNTLFWGISAGSQFVVQYRFGPGTLTNPTEHVTDHPAAGPTGPQACGTCYPTTRKNHSFYYGTSATPLCPGSPLNDGVCDAQFLGTASLAYIVPVEETSFGAIKGLYR